MHLRYFAELSVTALAINVFGFAHPAGILLLSFPLAVYFAVRAYIAERPQKLITKRKSATRAFAKCAKRKRARRVIARMPMMFTTSKSLWCCAKIVGLTVATTSKTWLYKGLELPAPPRAVSRYYERT